MLAASEKVCCTDSFISKVQSGVSIPATQWHPAYPQGSSTGAIFNAFLDKFVEVLPADPERTTDKPVILFIDNHRTHITAENIVKAQKLHIVFVGLPENTTNELQPLDKHDFMLMKRAWRKFLLKYVMRSGCRQSHDPLSPPHTCMPHMSPTQPLRSHYANLPGHMTEEIDIMLAMKAMTAGLTSSVIRLSFRWTGLCPYEGKHRHPDAPQEQACHQGRAAGGTV